MSRVCSRCGSQDEEGAFCGNCGAPMADSAPSPRHQAEEPPTTPLPTTPPTGGEPGGAHQAPPPAYGGGSGPAYQEPPPPQQQQPGPPPGWQPPPPQPQQPGSQQPGPHPGWQGPPGQQQPPPAYPPQGYAPQGYPQQGYSGYQQPRAATVNPFVGVPVGDYLRDGLAAVFLFAALGKTWGFGDGSYGLASGSDHWWVIVSALLGVASLAVPYVLKSRAVAALTPQTATLLKLALNVPMFVSVLAAVVLELVHVSDEYEGGIGAAVALGLAGSLLAAQPREADEDPAHRDDGLWWALTRGFTVAAVVAALGTFVAFTIRDLPGSSLLYDRVPAYIGAILLLVPVLTAVVLAWPAVGLITGNGAMRRVFAAVALTDVAAALFTTTGSDGLFVGSVVEKWYGQGFGIGGTFLIGAAGALAVCRPAVRSTTYGDPVDSWVRTARAALRVSAVGLVVVAGFVVGIMIARQGGWPAAGITGAVLALVAAAGCFAASMMLGDVRSRRTLALAVIGGVVVAAIIAVSVLHGSNDLGYYLFGYDTAVWFVLPLLAAYAVTLPKEVRDALPPLVPQRPAPQYGKQYGQQPGQPPYGQPPSGPPSYGPQGGQPTGQPPAWGAPPPQQQWGPPQQQPAAPPPQQQWGPPQQQPAAPPPAPRAGEPEQGGEHPGEPRP